MSRRYPNRAGRFTLKTYPKWSTKVEAGDTWRSSDGRAHAWRVYGTVCRISTTDPDRIAHLRRLTRVDEVGHAVVGGLLVLFELSAAKLNTKTLRRILDPDYGHRIAPNAASESSSETIPAT